MKNLVFAAAAVFACESAAFGQSQKLKKWELPKDLEIELALSAAPKPIRKAAGVYLYTRNAGFQLERKSTNGFNCIVGRTDIQVLPVLKEKKYRDDILIPICYDAVGSKHILPAWLLAAELRSKGYSVEKMLAKLAASVKEPPKSGLSPMVSPFLRTYMGPTPMVDNFNYPHYMFYAPGVTNKSVHGQPGHPVYPWVDGELPHHGKHAYHMHAVGRAERLQINREYAGMLQRLCDLKGYCNFFDMRLRTSLTRAQLNANLKNELRSIVK